MVDLGLKFDDSRRQDADYIRQGVDIAVEEMEM